MKIIERMQLLQDMVDENSDALGLMLPVESVQALLQYGADRKQTQRKYNQERTKVLYYKEALASAKAELKRRKKEDEPGNTR